MGRSPCCDKIGLKKGPWTPEEDHKLLAYIDEHGHGSWRALPSRAGLQRCGKSCRLRWTNYLRPDIKRGKFSLQEEQTIIQLHALLGNRWSAIATHLPKRTDNEIKNYWNTHLKKRLAKMGIDPLTHKPKNDAILSPTTGGQSKNSANLSHMAQWESARLEAEARLVRQSKLCGSSNPPNHQLSSPEFAPPLCLDILKAWNGTLTKSTEAKGRGNGDSVAGIGGDLESPTSTLSFLENAPPIPATRMGENSINFIEFVNNSGSCEDGIMKEVGNHEDWKGLKNSTHYKEGIGNSMSFTSGLHDMTTTVETGWAHESLRPDDDDEHVPSGMFVEKFTELLLNNSGGDRSTFSEDGGESDVGDGSGPSTGGGDGGDCDYYEDNKSYWNSILNLVSSSPSDSPMF